MEEKHDYTGFAIENILDPIIKAIEQGEGTQEKKAELKKKAFQDFLNEAKEYEECLGFENMKVEQLQKEYERIVKKQNLEER